MNKIKTTVYSVFVAAILTLASSVLHAQDINTPGTKATGGTTTRPTGGGGGRTTGGGRSTGGRTTGGGRSTGGRGGGGRGAGGVAGPVAGTVRTASAPVNNSFRSAQFISGNSGRVTGRNTGANREPGEPGHVASTSGGTASVWYRWTAPATGSFNVNTAGSDYDTLLAVYTGSGINGLSVIANNDDFNNTLQSSVTFNAVAGATYYIAVDGFNGAAGNIALNWRPGQPVAATRPPTGNGSGNSSDAADATDAGSGSSSSGNTPANDNVINALVLSGRSGRVGGSNVGASRESGEPNHADRQGSASVHYRWTAPSSGRVTFSTAGSSFDTLLAVYTVSGNNVNAVASNDDINNSLQSRVTFNAVAGTVYIIAIDGYNGAEGSIVLSWN